MDLTWDPSSVFDRLHEVWSAPRSAPGAERFLSTNQLPICLLTNAENDSLHAALERLDLEFEHIVPSEDCRAYKPDRSVLTVGIEAQGLESQNVVHIGDSL